MSALFAADGARARVIGYNTQWRGGRGATAFAYAGAVNRAQLNPAQRDIIAHHVGALTRIFGLRGLNSLDFILNDGRPEVLEINPRPTATCELYEPEMPDGMVALHVQACRDGLPEHRLIAGAKVRAHAIVYAQISCRVPVGMQWPQWCRDLPQIGVNVSAGEPVCSVHVEDEDVTNVERMIAARRQSVLTSLNLWPLAA